MRYITIGRIPNGGINSTNNDNIIHNNIFNKIIPTITPLLLSMESINTTYSSYIEPGMQDLDHRNQTMETFIDLCDICQYQC